MGRETLYVVCLGCSCTLPPVPHGGAVECPRCQDWRSDTGVKVRMLCFMGGSHHGRVEWHGGTRSPFRLMLTQASDTGWGVPPLASYLPKDAYELSGDLYLYVGPEGA